MIYLLLKELLDVWLPPVLPDGFDFGVDAVVVGAEDVQDAGRLRQFVQGCVAALEVFVEKIGSLGQGRVSVNVVHAGKEEVVRVD